MIYPQLVQPSTLGSSLHFTLLTPHHNLLCHSDLPSLSHSKQTTTHGWSQDVSCPFAQFAPAQEKAIGLTVGGQSSPSSSPPSLYPAPWKHVARWSSLLCGQQKHFSSWTKGIKQSTLLWICDMPKHLSELCSLLHRVKGYVCYETVSVMGHYLRHQNHIKEYNISDIWFSC